VTVRAHEWAISYILANRPCTRATHPWASAQRVHADAARRHRERTSMLPRPSATVSAGSAELSRYLRRLWHASVASLVDFCCGAVEPLSVAAAARGARHRDHEAKIALV